MHHNCLKRLLKLIRSLNTTYYMIIVYIIVDRYKYMIILNKYTYLVVLMYDQVNL